MAAEMIPDQPGREIGFEPLLDELLVIFCPGWEMPGIMAGEHQHHRCEVKRFQLGKTAEADPTTTRQHADLLIRAAMHDQCRSGIRQLVRPLTDALGYRPVQTAIIDYMRTGSDAEKVGATMAWYFAQPGLKYASWDNLRHGISTKKSRAAQEALADLRDAYRAACLVAFLACQDPATRHDLALWINRDPAAYPEHLRPGHQQAWDIITGDPKRYRLVLQCSGSACAPPQQ